MTAPDNASAAQHCTQCGMACSPSEYHPYAACLMFMACKNGDTVRASLEAVKEHALAAAPPAAATKADAEAELRVDLRKQAHELAVSMRHSAGTWMVPGWDGHKVANLLDAIRAIAAPGAGKETPE
jgi:hypothetical protein